MSNLGLVGLMASMNPGDPLPWQLRLLSFRGNVKSRYCKNGADISGWFGVAGST